LTSALFLRSTTLHKYRLPSAWKWINHLKTALGKNEAPATHDKPCCNPFVVAALKIRCSSPKSAPLLAKNFVAVPFAAVVANRLIHLKNWLKTVFGLHRYSLCAIVAQSCSVLFYCAAPHA